MSEIVNCHANIPFGLPAMNEVLAAKGNVFSRGKMRTSSYTVMKKKYGKVIAAELVRQQCIPKTPYIMIEPSFVWYEPHKRRDLDNISGGGRKFLMDSMVDVGIIANDNLVHIQKMSDAYAPSETGERYVHVSWEVIQQ